MLRAGRRCPRVASRETWRVAEAEDGVLSGGASIVTPESSWTGESAWSGGKYVSLPAGARVAFGSASDSLIQPVAWRTEGSGGGRTAWSRRRSARSSHENAGAQGASEVPGFLEVSTLPGVLRSGPFSAAATRGTVSLDAALIQPLLEHVVLGRGAAAQAVVRSFDTRTRSAALDLPGAGPVRVSSYDSGGRLDRRSTQRGQVRARVLPGGFTIAER